VTRCGHLKQNEKEWYPKEPTDEKTELSIPKLKSFCLKMLENRVVENFSMVVISIYTVFILFDLTFSDIFSIDVNLMA
jgi:hypothetical protein